MKLIAIFFVCFTLSISAHAQNADSTFFDEPELEQSALDKSKIYYGGYLNMSFGTYTVIGATPLVAYKVNPRFSVGTQFTYEYVKDKRYADVYENSNYGISLFSRYRLMPQLYAHVEFSEMNYKLFYFDGGNTRQWVPFLWLGGGYSQPIAPNVWFNAQVLFDVINHEHSPYAEWDPYYSVGFGVGF